MQANDKNIQTFIRSIPNIASLSLRAHILLVGYYLYNSGTPEFSPLILKNAFLKVRLPYNSDKVNSTLKELSTGDKSPLISRKKDKYVISIYGDEEIKVYLKNKPQIETGITSLKDLLLKVNNNNQRLFLGEAISCAEARSYRASIVMMWLFAIDHLQEYVMNKKLLYFNKAMSKNPRLKSIKTKDDFADLRESVFIEILRSADIISKGVKKILDTKLDTRNICAHPSDIVIKESTVVEFIDTLVENVILKYK